MNTLRQIKLGMFLRPAGHHIAAWRHPEAQADGGVNFRALRGGGADRRARPVRHAVLGRFGDRVDGARGKPCIACPTSPGSSRFLLAALAPVTTHIGLVCTATTTYDEPYHVARQASLHSI